MPTPSDTRNRQNAPADQCGPPMTAAKPKQEAPAKIRWTPAAVKALGVRTDVPTAGAILGGLCRDEAYRSVKRGTFPVPVIKVGRRLVVPVQPILDLLGLGAGDEPH